MESLKELLSFKSGEMPIGLGIGVAHVDKHLVFKHNSFSVSLARDKVGKTFLKLWYYVVQAKKNGLRFHVRASENDTWTMKMYINQFLEGKSIHKIPEETIIKNDTWINYHFNFIEGKMDFYKLVEIALKDKRDCLWIDPYNGLDKPSGNEHQYDYQVVRDCNDLKKQVGSIDISIHPVTELNRMMITDKNDEFFGYPAPARKWHSEGGGKWQNSADMFYSFHRFTTHTQYKYMTRLYVENIRVTETGGEVTPENGYLIFEFNPQSCRFKVSGIDPLDNKDSLDFSKAEEVFF